VPIKAKTRRFFSIILTVLVVILSVATVLGFFGEYWWGLDVFAHFRLQYAIALVVLLVLGMFLRMFALSVVAVVFVITNLVFVLPYFYPSQEAFSTSEASSTFMFANVFALNNSYDRIADSINMADPDIVFLSEIDRQTYEEVALRLPNYQTSLHEATIDLGMAAFTKEDLPGSMKSVYFDGSRMPTIHVNLPHGDANINVLGAHPREPLSPEKFRDRNAQMNALAKYVKEVDGSLILIGDMNNTPYSQLFRKFLRESELADSRQSFGLQGSWPVQLPTPLMRIPLENAFITDDIHVSERYLGEKTGSDHFPIVVKVFVKVKE